MHKMLPTSVGQLILSGIGMGMGISGFSKPARLDNRKVETEVSPIGQVEDALYSGDLLGLAVRLAQKPE